MAKNIKVELFYLRQLFSRSFPLGYYINYFKNRFFDLMLLRHADAWKNDKPLHHDFEVHILSQQDGLWMLYWTIRSFLYYSGLNPKFIIHDDGTISPKWARVFESKFSHIHIM